MRRLVLGPIAVDLQSGEVQRGDERRQLRAKELAVLNHLHANRRPVPSSELLTTVWGVQASTRTRTVDTTVHRLRQQVEIDPSQPRYLVTVRGEGYLLRTASPTAWQVPTPVVSFVGREQELEALLAWLADPGPGRLLTVIGMGGVGKTRLVEEALHRARGHAAIQDRFPSGVTYVRLEGVAVGHLVGALLDALELPQAVDVSGLDLLARALRHRPVLLVMDNLEHLVDEAVVLAELLTRCPRLTILGTSRAALDLVPETRLPLQSLPRDAAVELLSRRVVERVIGREPPSDHWCDAAVDLLGGLPIALEMLAAAADGADPDSVLEAVRADLSTLRASSRDRPDRQRTLDALFAHSRSLISASAQSALTTLSVFRAGFSMRQAGAVGVTEGVLRTLVRQTLVARQGSRYALHPLIAALARAQATDAASLPRTRAAWVDTLLAELEDPDHPSWADIGPAWPDVAGAGESLLAHADPATIARAAPRWAALFRHRGDPRRGAEALEGAASAAEDQALRDTLTLLAVRLRIGTIAAGPLLTRAEAAQDAEAGLRATVLGDLHLELGEPERAREQFQAAAASSVPPRATDARLGLAECAVRLRDLDGADDALTALESSDLSARARLDTAMARVRWLLQAQHFERGRVQAAELHDALDAAHHAVQRAELERDLSMALREVGRPDEAMRWSLAAEESFRALGRLGEVSEVLSRRTAILAGPSHTDQALVACDEAIALAREVSSRRRLELAQFNKARVLRHASRHDEAAAVYQSLLDAGLSDAIRQEATASMLAESLLHQGMLPEAAAILDAQEVLLRDTGRILSWPRNRLIRAGVHLRAGELAAAAACCESALAHCVDRGHAGGMRLCLLHLTEVLVEARHARARDLVDWWLERGLARERDRIELGRWQDALRDAPAGPRLPSGVAPTIALARRWAAEV